MIYDSEHVAVSPAFPLRTHLRCVALRARRRDAVARAEAGHVVRRLGVRCQPSRRRQRRQSPHHDLTAHRLAFLVHTMIVSKYIVMNASVSLSLSLCVPRVSRKPHRRTTSTFWYACRLLPLLDTRLAALYFRFCGLRHVVTKWPSNVYEAPRLRVYAVAEWYSAI